jgi:LysR family transcriptional regulator, nitrogen assimilation regulatory protein
MDIKQLRAFLTIAETGSVTRASEVLHIVQPAVSRQLRLLEEDLGTPLFYRGRHGMEPTEAGTILIDRARRVLRELDQARDEIRPEPGALSGLVSVGLLPSTSDLLAAPLVCRLQELHPELKVNVTVGYAGHLRQWLEGGEVDVALLYDIRPSTALAIQMLLEERLYLVGPSEAGLRADVPVSLQEVADSRLILPTPPHGLRILFEHACAAAGITFAVAAQTNAMSVQKDLVIRGQGFTLLPSAAIHRDLAQGRLSASPITDPVLCRKIVLARRAGRYTSAQIHALSGSLFELVRSTVTEGLWPDADWLADQSSPPS